MQPIKFQDFKEEDIASIITPTPDSEKQQLSCLDPARIGWWHDHSTKFQRTLLQDPRDSTKQHRMIDVLNRDHYTIVIFLRRFGCPVCRSVTSGLTYLYQKILHKLFGERIRVVAIACEEEGVQEFLRMGYLSNSVYGKSDQPAIELYVNPGGTAFSLLSLPTLSIMNGYGAANIRKVSAAIALATSQPYFNKTSDFKGNYVQLGGMFIFTGMDEVPLLEFKETYSGNTPLLTDIFKVFDIRLDNPLIVEEFGAQDLSKFKVLHLASRAAQEVRSTQAAELKRALSEQALNVKSS